MVVPGFALDGVTDQDLLEAVLELSDQAIAACDRQGAVTAWNVVAERLFGRGRREVLGRPLVALFPVHLQAEVADVVAAVLAGDQVRQFETEARRPDGMPVSLSVSLSPLPVGAESPAGAVILVRDVTEQHLAQAALAEVEGRLRAGEALAHVGSWLWDVRTGAVQWSTECHRIHGVKPFDFHGTFECHLSRIHPADRERVRAAMTQAAAEAEAFEDRYRIIRPDEQIRVIRVRAEPAIGSAGDVLGLRGVGQDITEDGDIQEEHEHGREGRGQP